MRRPLGQANTGPANDNVRLVHGVKPQKPTPHDTHRIAGATLAGFVRPAGRKTDSRARTLSMTQRHVGAKREQSCFTRGTRAILRREKSHERHWADGQSARSGCIWPCAGPEHRMKEIFRRMTRRGGDANRLAASRRIANHQNRQGTFRPPASMWVKTARTNAQAGSFEGGALEHGGAASEC